VRKSRGRLAALALSTFRRLDDEHDDDEDYDNDNDNDLRQVVGSSAVER
jgi:hypothetical protein